MLNRKNMKIDLKNVEDVIRSYKTNSYVMSCFANKEDLYAQLKYDLGVLIDYIQRDLLYKYICENRDVDDILIRDVTLISIDEENDTIEISWDEMSEKKQYCFTLSDYNTFVSETLSKKIK